MTDKKLLINVLAFFTYYIISKYTTLFEDYGN
jgi:hypothetical protein